MSGWDYCHPEVETLAPGCDEEWFALPEYQRAHLHLYAVASVGAPEEQVQGLWDAICRRWPHPCQGWEVLPTATYGGRATLGLCWVP